MPDNPLARDPVLFPEIDPYVTRTARRRLAAHALLGERAAAPTACRSCSCTAVPAAAACRIIAATSIPRSGASCSSTSAARDARRRSPSSRATRRRHWSPTSSACARTCASTAGWCSAARGARRSRSRTPKRTRSVASGSCCAASSSRSAREIDWFMHGMRKVFPGGLARVRGLPAGSRARRSPRQLLSPAGRSRSRRASARRARVGSLRRRVLDAACRATTRRRNSTATRPRWRSRASRRITSCTTRSCSRASCSQASPGFATCRARSSRVATTSSARRSRPTLLARAWPEAEYVVVPDAGHSVREPGITRELVAAVERMQVKVV